jgi:hypothetical protein
MPNDSILTSTLTVATEQVAKTLEHKLMAVIRQTDWTETDILDVVFARPQPELGRSTITDDSTSGHAIDPLTTQTEIRVYRHSDHAPPLRTVATPNRRCDIYRLTVPLLEALRDDLEAHGYDVDALLNAPDTNGATGMKITTADLEFKLDLDFDHDR